MTNYKKNKLRKTKKYRQQKRKSLKKIKHKTRRYYKVKRGGGAGNPYGIDQFNKPLNYSGNAGWYGKYPVSTDQILYQRQAPKMSYSENLILANERIPGVNVAMTSPLMQKGGGSIPLYRQNETVLGEDQLDDFYPGPTHY